MQNRVNPHTTLKKNNISVFKELSDALAEKLMLLLGLGSEWL